MWQTGGVRGVEQLGRPRRGPPRALGACSAPGQGNGDCGDGDCGVARHCLGPGCPGMGLLCPARRDPYLSSRTSMVSRLYLRGQSRDVLDRKTPRRAGHLPRSWQHPCLAPPAHMAVGPARLCKHRRPALWGVMSVEVSARDPCPAGAQTPRGRQLSGSAALSTLSNSTYEVATPAGPGAPNSTDPAWARSRTRPRVITRAAPSQGGYWVKVRGMPIW